MKIYESCYEKVFTEQEDFSKRCDVSKVSTFNNVPLNTTLYINEFRSEMKAFEIDTFNHLVKITWLRRRFCYRGERRTRNKSNGRILDTAYGLFIRNFVGYDTKFLFGSSFSRIVGYMDDFFPNFDEGNPFEEDYKYPYKVMTLSHLSLVSNMDERMELLEYAEKHKLTYVKFLDYIINYINCYNEELEENKYEFIFRYNSLPCIKKVF